MAEIADLFRMQELQRLEHQAWLDVGILMKALGLDMNAGGNAEKLHASIVRWGEELAQLRMGDPEPLHAEMALRERRELYGKVVVCNESSAD